MEYPIVIGGSAGSFKILKRILAALPTKFNYPLVICVHRSKSSAGDFVGALSNTSNANICEVSSPTRIKPGQVYIAPANKHLIINDHLELILTEDKPVQYSRPSIDITMQSFARCFEQNLIGILVTGANNDGTLGLKAINEKGGITIVQDPLDAEISTMPESAIDAFHPDYILSADKIINFIEQIK